MAVTHIRKQVAKKVSNDYIIDLLAVSPAKAYHVLGDVPGV